MTDEREWIEREQMKGSRLAAANRAAFRAARERAQRTLDSIGESIETRREFLDLKNRAEDSQVGQGPLVPVAAQMEVEDDEWVYQTVDEETLQEMSHRVVLHTSAGDRRELFRTNNLDDAVAAASRIVEFADGCVLVETIDP